MTCTLCNAKRPAYAGVFIPKRPVAGAPSVLSYRLCHRCARRGWVERLDNKLMTQLRRMAAAGNN